MSKGLYRGIRSVLQANDSQLKEPHIAVFSVAAITSHQSELNQAQNGCIKLFRLQFAVTLSSLRGHTVRASRPIISVRMNQIYHISKHRCISVSWSSPSATVNQLVPRLQFRFPGLRLSRHMHAPQSVVTISVVTTPINFL